ncbi:ABC transporter permease [Marinobacterium lutimaris]|uniref:Transport permease protein n=1 Tax=Marinobacterium lutimaris TaxID=568106 RepID=A0A1H6CQX5_9GAMM|nr:ABC transporter permease [Marinobacterium lutimaris]SEG75439.1 ABC-2 type transport system permease protein [Marinobacterium lutimaris]
MTASLIAFIYRVINLCNKEMLAVLKDPANRVILIVPPLLQSLLFGYAANFDLTDVPYVVLDQSSTESSRTLLDRVDGTGVFHRVATLHSSAEIERFIGNGEALIALHFPSDFEERLSSGDTAPLQLIVDGRNSATGNSAVGYVRSIVAGFNQRLNPETAVSVEVEARSWFNPNLETRWIIMPAMIAALSMIQTMMLSALSVAREREQGTFDQLLVTPHTPFEILISKAIPPIIIGLVQSTLVLVVARYWFHIPMAGSVGTLYAGLLMFTIASVGVGLSISALSANMHQAMLYTFVLIMPLMLLSGLATPVANMPDLLQTLTYANPLRFAIHLVRGVYLEGAQLGDVWRDMVPLMLIAVFTLPLAAWLFRHRLI